MNQRINKTGELEEPFVELDEIAQRQFNRKGAHHFMKYDDFLKSVDKHFATSLGSLDDQEYEIKVHLKVNKQTLKSTEHKKVAVKKTEKNSTRPYILVQGVILIRQMHEPCTIKLVKLLMMM